MPSTSRASSADGAALHEALATWIVLGLVALAVLVTYARLPAADLYGTSEEGLAGGLGRALVFLNYPVAISAVALALVAAERLARRGADVVAAISIALCLVVVIPGVVEQDDLDAKPANAVPALGVAGALALTLAAVRLRGVGRFERRLRGDSARLLLTAILLLGAIPWFAAELGFYASFDGLFMSDEVVPEPGDPDIRAVHLGYHHGLGGALLALMVFGLTRQLGRIRRRAVRMGLSAYLALLLVYGLVNGLEDFWLEQLVKRGTTSHRVPSFLRPDADPKWLLLLAVAAVVFAAFTRVRPPAVR